MLVKPPLGLEPRISCSVDRRLNHWAMGAFVKGGGKLLQEGRVAWTRRH